MNTPATDLTAARDDLRFIREVLDRTAPSFRPLAPSFRPLAPSFFRAGLVWLLFALLRFSVSGLDLLAYLWPPLFFPMIPLLLTAVVLEDKPLGCLGLVILVLCLAYLAVNLLPGAASGQSLLVFSALVALVKDFLPPIALLLTARRLKKLPEGA